MGPLSLFLVNNLLFVRTMEAQQTSPPRLAALREVFMQPKSPPTLDGMNAAAVSFSVAPNTSTMVHRSRKQLYSFAKNDRFGSSLLDMFGADAYAEHVNATFVGACRPDAQRLQLEQKKTHVLALDQEKTRVLHRLGLLHWKEYGIACPDDDDDEVMIDPTLYRDHPMEHFTDTWLDSLRTKIVLSKHPSLEKDVLRTPNVFSVVVHLRRGDLDVCHRLHGFRYIPNAYYLAVMDAIEEENANRRMEVIFYTESAEEHAKQPQLESLQVFRDRNYTIVMGGDEVSVWTSMMEADIFVMSQSFFSTIPAILNIHGRVFFPPPHGLNRHAMQPLGHWELPRPKWTQLVKEERERLQRENCPDMMALGSVQ